MRRDTDHVRANLSLEPKPFTARIETGDLLRYAEAVEASEPWFSNERAARASRYGTLIAAPTYLITMRGLLTQSLADAGYTRPLPNSVDGGSEWEYLEPIRPGDTITGTARIVDYVERETSLGPAQFQVIEITFRNQFDQIVVRERDTWIFYP